MTVANEQEQAAFPRDEVEAAFAEYRRRGIGALDWPGWAALFTEDARYVEHVLGTFEGGQAISDWIVSCMAGFPSMSFDLDWALIDGNRIVFYIWNLLPDPAGTGRRFGFPNATVLEYAGDGRWSYEEDFYNPANANAVVSEWLAAGGSTSTPPDKSLRAIPDTYPAPKTPPYPVEEVEREFAAYVERGRVAVETGDWVQWANQFSPDASYNEHHYGTFTGRDAIRQWITDVMKPFPTMEFPVDWHMIDGNRVVMLCQNRLPDPEGRGRLFQFPVITVLHYDGDGQWGYEEDIYNPEEVPPIVTKWVEAGGVIPQG